MKALEERIIKDGKILSGDVLNVGSFINQMVDTDLLKLMAKEVNASYIDLYLIFSIENIPPAKTRMIIGITQKKRLNPFIIQLYTPHPR